jgi:uncharacterized protein (DUF2141 family)
MAILFQIAKKLASGVCIMLKVFVSLSAFALLIVAGGAMAGTPITNDLARCNSGKGPSVLVTVRGVKQAAGLVRVQSYPATSAAWLNKGKWINRIEARASGGAMSFCVPVPAAGNYGIAVRHDLNANGKTDIRQDGGGFSNNPSISIFNLGKPSVSKASFYAGEGVTKIAINLKYFS